METATGDIKNTLIDEVDTAVEEVQIDIESHIDAEVDTLKNELYLILVDQGFLQVEDLSVAMGGTCPNIRIDCIGQG